MEAQNIIVVDEFDGKFLINNSYRPIAEALVAKYKELKHIHVDSILFIENTEDRKKKNNKTVYAQVSLMQEKWNDIIYQTTGIHFDFMMEIYKVNISAMSRAQIIALIYHELRHIGPGGEILSHDIEEWITMVEKLGLDWGTTKASIPNILEEGIDWESIQGPATLFPVETTLKLIK